MSKCAHTAWIPNEVRLHGDDIQVSITCDDCDAEGYLHINLAILEEVAPGVDLKWKKQAPQIMYDASQPGEPPLRDHVPIFDADGCNVHDGKLRLWRVSQIYPFHCEELWVPLRDVVRVILAELRENSDAELSTRQSPSGT
jgi:hypothetical protein